MNSGNNLRKECASWNSAEEMKGKNMKKKRSLSKAKIAEISTLIGASFWDLPYDEVEGFKLYDLMHSEGDT